MTYVTRDPKVSLHCLPSCPCQRERQAVIDAAREMYNSQIDVEYRASVRKLERALANCND